jgi:hypothetical protein
MLVHQRRRRIAPEQLRYNQQVNLLAFWSLREDMVTAAVRHEVDDAAAVQ